MAIATRFLPRRELIPGSIVQRVNFVITMWSNPCDAPWVLYVEAMWPAALDAFVTIIDFSCADIARAIFRPAGLMGGGLRHGRRRRPGLNRRLQRLFGPLRKLQDRKIGNGLKFLWIVDTGLQRILWYFVLVDAATEFLYRWTSGVYATQECLMAGGPGAALARDGGDLILGIGGWQAQTWEELVYDRGDATITLASGRTGNGRWLFTAGATCNNASGEGTLVQMRLREPGGMGVIDTDGPVELPFNGSADLVVSAIVEGGTSVVVEFAGFHGNFWTDRANFAIIGRPLEGVPDVC